MTGLHLTADLQGCPRRVPALTEPAALRTLCLQAVQAAGLTPVGELFHAFSMPQGQPGGVTGVVLLAESHLAVHTWPELGAVTLDAYVCNVSADHSAQAQALVDALVAGFDPQHVAHRRLQRGTLGMGASGAWADRRP